MIVDDERTRNPAHLAFIRRRPCAVPGCRADRVDPHHLTHVQPKAKGLKAGDQWTVPLCRRHHNQLHARGGEASWWRIVQVNPVALAVKLWEQTVVPQFEIPKNETD